MKTQPSRSVLEVEISCMVVWVRGGGGCDVSLVRYSQRIREQPSVISSLQKPRCLCLLAETCSKQEYEYCESDPPEPVRLVRLLPDHLNFSVPNTCFLLWRACASAMSYTKYEGPWYYRTDQKLLLVVL